MLAWNVTQTSFSLPFEFEEVTVERLKIRLVTAIQSTIVLIDVGVSTMSIDRVLSLERHDSHSVSGNVFTSSASEAVVKVNCTMFWNCRKLHTCC